MARLLVCCTTVVLTILLAPRDALACSCMDPGPPCQNAFRVDAVFVGTVQSITPVFDDGPPLPPDVGRFPRTRVVHLTAVTPFLGIQASSVTVHTAGSGPACGYDFKVGERYVVYAYKNAEARVLQTSICSRTKPIKDAREDLEFLQTLSRPSAKARIYGTINHAEPDLSSGQPRQYGPVRDVLVSVRGLGIAADASTDEAGRYELRVPAGKYEVSMVAPPGFSDRYLQRNVEVRDTRACQLVDFHLRFDGRIRGSVLQSTRQPVRGVSVEVIPVGVGANTPYVAILNAVSDQNGNYEVADVPPGRYRVAIGFSRKLDEETVFPLTFYPGERAPGSAFVVEVPDGGRHIELEPMIVPPARQQHRITGFVVFEDGRSAPGSYVTLWDATAKWKQVARGVKVEFDGTFSFLAHEGLSYIVRASYRDEGTQSDFSGSAGPVDVTRQTPPLRVALAIQKR